jgi:type I restriction enzyme S subunit
MKNNWEIKTLREVCEFRRGLTYSKKDEASLSKNAILRANNITLAANTLNFDDIRYISDDVIIPQEKKLVKGSVMICTASGSRSHLGKVAFIDKDYDYAFGGFMGLLVPNSEIIDPKYFFVILTSGQFRDHINSLTSGANINNLKFSQIKDYQVTVPPLLEQKRIVGILDEKFKAIEELKKVTEAQIQDAKELFESRLSEIFTNSEKGSDEVALSDVSSIETKLIDPKEKKYKSHLHIGAGNIESKTGILSDIKTAEEEKLISGKFLFDTNTILYSKIRPYLMKVARPVFSGLCSADIYPLVAKKDVLNKDFLFYLLLSKNFTDYAVAGSDRAGMPKVNRDHLFAYRFSLPDFKMQVKLVNELDELYEKSKMLETVFLNKVHDLEELKKSYLAQAFAGKL